MQKYVVKDNALIDACFDLSLAEYRILLLGMVVAREHESLDTFTPVEIRGLDYAQQFDLDRSTAYESLADASKTLLKRTYSFKDTYRGKEAVSDVHWLTQATYVSSDGLVVLYFTHQTINLISRLEEHFTRYHIDQVSKFKSKYSIRLYELVIKWLENKKTQKYAIEDFREKMGLSNEYKQMSDFKINVLDKALKEINDYSDINLKYKQFKKGRVITDFQFEVTRKESSQSSPKQTEKRDKNTVDMFCNMSDAQINKYSTVLSKLPELSELSNFPDYSTFALWISGILRDPKSVREETAKRIFKALYQKTDFK